jgi:predicted nucleic acid-binding protein
MSTEVKSQAGAWQVYDRWLEDPHTVFLEEPLGLDPTLRDRSQQTHAAPNDWADAYLVAFASVSGLQIVTFDRGMREKTSGVLLLAN